MFDANAETAKVRVAAISVASNSFLIVLKVTVGVLTGSMSVISEAIHSGIDLLAAGLALFAVRHADRPADRTHSYGHGKVENMAGTVEALLIFGAALWIVYEAVRRLLIDKPVQAVGWGVAVMVLSAMLNTVVSELLFRVGRRSESVALIADAWHLRTDVWTSTGVATALLVLWVGHRVAPTIELAWIDPLAAIAVALLIGRAAIELTVQSGRDLLDWSLPRHEEDSIREYLATLTPTVCGFHGLRTRKAGARRFVDVHVLVDEDLRVHTAHDIADQVAEGIQQRFPGSSVTVHIEPCAAKCEGDCRSGCLLSDARREQVRLRHLHD